MAFGIVTSTQSNTCGSTDVDQYVGGNLQSKSPIIGLVKMYMQCKEKGVVLQCVYPVFCIPAAIPFIVMIMVSSTAATRGLF